MSNRHRFVTLLASIVLSLSTLLVVSTIDFERSAGAALSNDASCSNDMDGTESTRETFHLVAAVETAAVSSVVACEFELVKCAKTLVSLHRPPPPLFSPVQPSSSTPSTISMVAFVYLLSRYLALVVVALVSSLGSGKCRNIWKARHHAVITSRTLSRRQRYPIHVFLEPQFCPQQGPELFFF